MLACYKEEKIIATTKQTKSNNGQRSKTAYQSQDDSS